MGKAMGMAGYRVLFSFFFFGYHLVATLMLKSAPSILSW